MSGRQAGQWPLTGRDGELAAFRQAWADRRYRGVVITGPAGIGKSRLAAECLALAQRQGWKGRRTTASTAAAAVPLGALAHLIPTGVDLSDPVQGFAQVARALAGPGRDRRWAVLVDDLHLLDAVSTVLLRQLMDAEVVRLIATVRSGEPLSEAVNALTSEYAVHRIDLAAFDREQAQTVLEAALGGPVGRLTLHELCTSSGGNALYLRELVTGALQAGKLVHDGKIWELADGGSIGTPRLTELIDARLATTDRAARTILELLALCELLPVADAQDVASPDVLARLEEAGLVQVVSDRRRMVLQLDHPLYGEVLRERIPFLRRRNLLLGQAERTEAHGARRRDDTLHIATWRLAATGTADPALLVQAAALARHAHDGPRVVALLEALPEEFRTTATRLMHGESLYELARWEEAESVLSDASDKAVDEQDTVTVTTARTMNLFWFAGRTADALDINQAAQQQVASASALRALAIHEGTMRTVSGEPVRGLALLEQQLEADFDQAMDANTWYYGAQMKAAGLAMTGRTEEAAAMAELSCSVVQRFGQEDASRTLMPRAASTAALVFAMTEGGQLSEARAAGEQAAAELVEARLPSPRVALSYFIGRLEWLAGHPDSARRWFAEATALAQAQRQTRYLQVAPAGMAAAAAVLGDLDSAEEALAEARATPPMGLLTGEERLGEAWLLAARGRLAEARGVLAAAAEAARATGHMTSEALLLTDLARLGGAEDVRDRLAELAEQCDGVLAPARARLAAALASEDPDRSVSVARELEAMGVDLLAAEAATAAATAWRRTGHHRQAAAAAQLAQACANRCQGARTPLLSTAEIADMLTTREREIALLAATGTSSKDIAATLHLSVRTIDNHLQRAYTKLGVSARRELAEMLDRTADRRRP